MTSLSRRPSGEAALGEWIELCDEQAQSRVIIAPARGGLVTSFCVAGRELLYLDPATLSDVTKNVRGGVPVLFPSPGKLEKDAWQCAGLSGELKQHGFARNHAFTVTQAASERAEVVMELRSSATTLAVYPWAFTFELTFRLEGTRLRIAASIENRSDRVMPFALGYHPYFHVTDKASAHVNLSGTRVFDNVTKETTAFTGFDLTASEVDLHVLDNPRPEAVLAMPDGRLELRGSSEMGVWVVWTLAGKDYVCVEPWSAPGNALNNGERLTQLPPGGVQQIYFDLEWFASKT